MKARLLSVEAERTLNYDGAGSIIKGEVRLLGGWEEAQELIRHGEGLVLVPMNKQPQVFDVKKGDEVKYQFIRGSGGREPEISIWMKVKSVDGDMITSSQNGQYGPYEFRVLKCQIVEHRPKGSKASSKKPVVENPKKVEDPRPDDEISSLRKQIQEFNLT